jgi:uncharacterized membrane protein HdeD (DUF308 family)
MHTRHGEVFRPVPEADIKPLTRSWWLMLLRGIAGVLFGIAAFVWPGLTVLALTLLYGAFALADGVFSLGAAITGSGNDKSIPTWWLVLIGLLGIVAGIVAFLWPGLTAFALVIMIGAWAVTIGILEIIGAIWLRHELEDEWLLIAAGLLSVLFGAALLLRPGAGALALAWAIGAFALVSGLLHIAFAFRLKGVADRRPAGTAGLASGGHRQ